MIAKAVVRNLPYRQHFSASIRRMATFVTEDLRQDALYDVIIVGAGVSSLCANHTFRTKYGVPAEKILILEAQDYIGGRIRQGENFIPNGGLIELGGEILHGEETLLTQFGREMGEPMKPLYVWAHGDGGPMEEPVDRHYGLYFSAKSNRLMRFDTSEKDFDHLSEVLEKIAAEYNEEDFPLDMTLQDYLISQGCNEEMVSMANAGFANTLCTKNTDLSLRQVIRWGKQWDTEGENDGDFKYRGTFRALITFLRKSLDENLQVMLNTPVQSITRLPHETSPTTTVTTKDGRTFHSKAVLVTSSIYVLQHPELLSFQPPLPEKYQAALSTVVMHRAMKIFVRFSQPCWPIGLQGMIMAPEETPSKTAFVPEVWFNCIPCDAHVSSYTHSDPAMRHHPVGCQECGFYITGFCTTDFAGFLDDTYEDDSDICNVLVKQMDRILSQLRPKHHLLPHEYLDDSSSSNEDSSSASSSASSESVPPGIQVPQFPLPSEVYMHGRVQRWTPTRHPYIGGGYASGLPIQQANSHALQPGDYAKVFGEAGLDNLVFFAGEGVNFPAGATAHAALESGVRAAEKIAEGVLGLSKLTH